MPPDGERRPLVTDGAVTPDEEIITTIPQGMDERGLTPAADTMPPMEQRAGGVVRVNLARAVGANCGDCGATFASTGTAASHARSARHRVEVRYQSQFVFAPIETLDGTK